MFRTSTGKATPAQVQRFDAIKDLGCVACLSLGFPNVPPDIHHLIDGNERIGHDHTIGLCEWHHRGIPLNGMSTKACTDLFGPSLRHHGAKPFRERFGTDAELLKMQNALLERMEAIRCAA